MELINLFTAVPKVALFLLLIVGGVIVAEIFYFSKRRAKTGESPPPPPTPPTPLTVEVVPETPVKKFNPSSKTLIAALFATLIAISIPAAVYLVKQRQELRKEAAEQAILLGRVVNTDATYSSCHEQRFFYGDNCGNEQCHGAPNYRITWTQGDRSKTIANNDCFPQNGPRKPRYTFEWTDNPLSDSDGEEITISISTDGSVPLQSWSLATTDSERNELPGSNQSGVFSSPGPNQTLRVKVYKQGSYKWNHLWFFAFTPTTPTPTPTSSPSPTPTSTPTPTPSPGSSPSPSPAPSPSPSPGASPPPSPTPTPRVSPSPTPRVEVPVTPQAGGLWPTILIILGGVILFTLGFVL